MDERLAPSRHGVIGALYANKPSAGLGVWWLDTCIYSKKDGKLHKRPPALRPLTPFFWIGDISSYWPRDRAAIGSAAAASSERSIVPTRPSQALGERAKERPSGIFVRASEIDHSSPPARRLAGPLSWDTKGGPNTGGHDWTSMLKLANPMDPEAKQTSLSPAADLPTAEHLLTQLFFGVWGQERDGTSNTTLPGPGQFACSLDGVHYDPGNGRIARALQRLCLKRCPSRSACEAPSRDRGREVLGNRIEAYLDPCLREALHRRLYTSRVGTRGPAPLSKTDLYGLDLVSLRELCSAVAEHVKPIGPKAEGVLHFWTGPSALRWQVVTAIRNFPSSG